MSKDKKKTVLLKAVSLCLLSALFITGCADQSPVETLPQGGFVEAPAAKHKTVTVEKGDFIQTETDTLRLVYTQIAELSWDQSNACYQEVFVKKNQKVKAGDVLISFTIQGSEAELASLQLQLKRANENLQRGRESREQTIRVRKEVAVGLESYDRQIALLEVEKLQAEYEQFLYQASREVAQLEQKIADIEAQKENNVLRAPFDGVISKVISCSLGDNVVPGQVLITMYSPDSVRLRARTTTTPLYNMPVTVETTNIGDVYTGRVVAAPNAVPSPLKQNTVLVQLDGEVSTELFSRTLKLTFETQRIHNVLTVSRKAIQTEGEKTFVYVLDGDMVQKRYIEVKTGLSATAWVLDGLTEGMTVIAD